MARQAKTQPAAATAPVAAESAAAQPVTDGAEPTTTEQTEIPGVFVRATVDRRCRAGYCFDRDGLGFAEGVLSPEQLEALEADPLLKVEYGSFPADDTE